MAWLTGLTGLASTTGVYFLEAESAMASNMKFGVVDE
jgi:hypothetical protein